MFKIIRSIIHHYEKKNEKIKILPPGHCQVKRGQYLSSRIVGFSAQTPAAQHQPAATLITQHHLYKKVTDLPAIISRPTMPYN